jgi:hypothetical protein
MYKSWDENTVIYKFLSAFVKRFEESQKDVRRVLRSHWIDTAHGSNIDRLGALFNLQRTENESDSDFKDKVKNAIQEYRGGGTVKSILATLKATLGATNGDAIKLIENPPQKMRVEKVIRAGDTWSMRSESIADVQPSLRIKVLEENAEAKNPTLQNLTTKETISYSDSLKTGEELTIKDGKATLDKTSVTKKFEGTEITLTRRDSTWQYTEALSEKIGLFDTAAFDTSIFAVGIPEVSILYQWIAYRPASFEVQIPKEVLDRSGVEQERVEKLINSVKAAGVAASIKIT